MKFIKPKKLKGGDTVAIVSPSWGGPSVFPHVYELGLKMLREEFGLKVKEYPTARMDAKKLYENPEIRARDINETFSDPEVKAIISSIGGNDSVRILEYLDVESALKHPKIILGYSDMSTVLTYLNQAGLVTFNGPFIMSGFSQMNQFPSEFKLHIEQMLFEPSSTYEYKHYPQWSEGYPTWKNADDVGKVNEIHKNIDGWRWLQGDSVAQGRLFGGCIEVLEFMKSTVYWPEAKFWDKKILFFETSSDYGAVPDQFKSLLRNYGTQGVFDRISGILIGRARDYTGEQKKKLDRILAEVVGGEFGRKDLPVVSNMDFGHTDPQFILPLGVKAEIDCDAKTFKLLESPTAE